MSKLSRHHLRPRIQRAFVRWFRGSKSRFILPTQITDIDHRGISLKLAHHSDDAGDSGCRCLRLKPDNQVFKCVSTEHVQSMAKRSDAPRFMLHDLGINT